MLMHGQQLVSKHCHALTDPSYSLVKTVANNNNTLLRNLLSVNASKVEFFCFSFLPQNLIPSYSLIFFLCIFLTLNCLV